MARPRQVSDAQIVEAAKACFLEHGPSVSTTVIAERLGVSQAALFKRFGTKEELMLAALGSPESVPWAEKLARGPDDREIREQLIEIAEAASLYFEKLIPCMAMLRASGIAPEHIIQKDKVPPPVRGIKLMAEWFRRAQNEGRIRAGDPESLGTAFMGALQARPFVLHIAGQMLAARSARDYAESVVDAIWYGLSPRGGGREG